MATHATGHCRSAQRKKQQTGDHHSEETHSAHAASPGYHRDNTEHSYHQRSQSLLAASSVRILGMLYFEDGTVELLQDTWSWHEAPPWSRRQMWRGYSIFKKKEQSAAVRAQALS